MFDENEEWVNPAVSIGFDLGGEELVRAPTAGEEKLKRDVLRTQMLPAVRGGAGQTRQLYTPRQAFHAANQEDVSGIRASLVQKVAAIKARHAQTLADFRASTMEALNARALTQDEAKRLISLKTREVSDAQKAEVADAVRRARAEFRKAVDANRDRVTDAVRKRTVASRDARVRALQNEKRQFQSLVQEGKISPKVAASAIASINEDVDIVARGAPNAVGNAVSTLRARLADLNGSHQAISAAIAQAAGVGADFVTFGDIQIPLDSARAKRAAIAAEMEGVKTEMARLMPKRAAAVKYAPIRKDGSPASPEEVRAQMRYLQSLGNQKEAAKLAAILRGFSPQGRPIRVHIDADALRQMLPAGEKLAVTAPGTARSVLPTSLPTEMPSAIPYATVRHKEE